MTAEKVIAQAVWETYMVEAGHVMPAGLADKLAANAIPALEAAGYAVVKLVDPVFIDGDGRHSFTDGSDAGEVEASPGDGVVYHDSWEWTTGEAFDVARQWLSAARVAGVNRTGNEAGAS